MDGATLAISLRRAPDGSQTADLRFQAHGSAADATLAAGIPVRLDPQALLAEAPGDDAYGRILTAQLFAPPPLRQGWEQARAAALGAGVPLRVHLDLDAGSDALHGIHWEGLLDPVSDAPLALSEHLLVARTLASADLTPVRIPTRPELRALVVAASPADLPTFGLAPIDVPAEIARVVEALAPVPAAVVGAAPGAAAPRATLPAILAQLREGPQILYLVAHGTLAGDEPYLWLEHEDGGSDRVSGQLLVERLSALASRPLLVVLASCLSGGAGSASAALAALGPRLARAGVAAVIGMQGLLPGATVARLMPALFRELLRDGRVDRALAAARAALRDDPAWWMPALWLRVRDGRLWLDRPPVMDTRAAAEELAAALARAAAAHLSWLHAALPRRPRPTAQPYRALLAFGVEDAARFFGRDAAIEELAEQVAASRLVVVHARSGAGKSSLVSAGLVPRLFDEGWLPLVVRAGTDPGASLARALAPPSLGPPPALLGALRLPELLGALCRAGLRPGQRLALIIDQLEELFVAPADAAAREAFARDIAACLADPNLPAHLVLSVRGDHLSDLDQLSRHVPAILDRRYLVAPLRPPEAEEAIIRPLALLQPPRSMEPALLAELLGDLERGGMELPHLQILCTRLYEALGPDDRTITLGHYEQLGGSPGILGGYLRHEVERLGADASLARAILFALVSPARTRLRRDARDLREHLVQRADLGQLDLVLAALADARLVRRGEQADLATYELTHDYLVAEVLSWVTPEDLAARRARDTLRRALPAWQEHRWPMDAPALALIDQQHGRLAGLSVEELELLLHSAVAHHSSLELWAPAAHRAGVDIWPALQGLLAARDPAVRAATVAATASLGAAAIPTLARALADPVAPVRTRAILALARMSEPAAREALRGGLVHEVLVGGEDAPARLCIDRFPVTNEAFAAFLRARPGHPPPAGWEHAPPPRDQARYPVTGVSWHDAAAFAAWAGRRLPTAAEWQQAAGWPARRFPWGDRPLAQAANTREAGLGGTSRVGRFSPAGDSPSGAADMAGNVWEWLADTSGPRGAYRALRGGAWRYSAAFAASDYDGFWRPPDHRQDAVGFRLCLDLREDTEV